MKQSLAIDRSLLGLAGRAVRLLAMLHGHPGYSTLLVRCGLPCLVLLLAPLAAVHAVESLFDKSNLAAWCIPPWDGARKLVDAAHQASGKIHGTGFVSSEGLHHQRDRLHFDAASFREFGKRYAEEFQKLTAGK